MTIAGTRSRGWFLVAAALLAGCETPKPDAAPSSPRVSTFNERLVPYLPATRPADPVDAAFPDAPRDAARNVPLRYTVELWEILLPRDSVSTDAAFWKRVEESAGPDNQLMQKNGIRFGKLPASDLETVRRLIEDRGGKHTSYIGANGHQIEIPIRDEVPDQMIFYHNRQDELVGRSWERCENFLYFSFETTPRNPDLLRVALTPAVRSKEKKLQYATIPGRPDREIKTVVEQSNYDVTVKADISLDWLLVIAPSPEAQSRHTLGGTFLTVATPSEKRERLILVIPHAYTRDDSKTTAAMTP